MTNEQPFVHQALDRLDIEVFPQSLLAEFNGESVRLDNIYTGKQKQVAARSIVIVGLRLPNDRLYHELMAHEEKFPDMDIKSVTRIGDCLAAGAPVHAVYSGHQFARQLDDSSARLYLRDVPVTDYPPGEVI